MWARTQACRVVVRREGVRSRKQEVGSKSLPCSGIVEANPDVFYKLNSGEIPYEPEALTLDFCNFPGVENVDHKFFLPHIHVITFTYKNKAHLFTIWDFSHARFYEAKRWPLEPWYE